MQSNENFEIKKDFEKEDITREEKTTAEDMQREDEAVAVPHQSTKMEDDATTTTTARTKPKSSAIDEEAVIMPPPPPRPPSSAASSDKDEDELLSLQVLSARSSTPYTVQALCCNNANCDLGTTDSTTVSPVKEEEVMKNKGDMEETNQRSDEELEGKKYSRSDLMNIRDEMMTIMRPECLGSMRLKRLNLGKSENGTAINGNGNRNKHYRAPNPPNDLMPAFFKRKTAVLNGNGHSITYDNFKYTDSHPFGNHNIDGNSSSNYRRIGSGRLSNRDINWDYIPEEDPEKDNLPEFFTSKDTSNKRHVKKHEVDDNSNYVKRVINSVVGETSFQRSKNLTNSSAEERYSTNSSGTSNANNKSDEPEWFLCGPTSRLDTIELCGFNESDQQQIRLEMENAKNKPDANNNQEETTTNGRNAGGGHKEKKHLAFQFDDFSTTHADKTNRSASRMPSSKFMPLFNAKNSAEDKTVNSNASQSLSDFLKRSDMPSVQQKEKLNLTEIPSVDEIEAKWRTQQQHTDPKSKTSTENFRTSSENFKKMLNQLNQQQPTSVSSPPQQPQQPSQPMMNLFNNENLSNFIKQRNFQQQLLQKQQQQAAIAQLQLNAVLSRPDTQMLLLSLARGEISKHGLIVQLANPNLTPADREAISAVLTFSAAGQYHHQLAVNSNHQQQQQFIANQLQNLALLQQMNKNTNTAAAAVATGKRNATGSGFQANGGGGGVGSNPRTFSQEELQSHANYILHNAMMKKKLEEQTSLGMQKILQLQNSMLNNNYNNTNSRAKDSLAGSKNQQRQSQQLHNQQRQRKGSNAGNRIIGRRRSTSSSSSNATVNASQMKLAADLEFRQLEQRRNTIATTTVGADEYHQIS